MSQPGHLSHEGLATEYALRQYGPALQQPDDDRYTHTQNAIGAIPEGPVVLCGVGPGLSELSGEQQAVLRKKGNRTIVLDFSSRVLGSIQKLLPESERIEHDVSDGLSTAFDEFIREGLKGKQPPDAIAFILSLVTQEIWQKMQTVCSQAKIGLDIGSVLTQQGVEASEVQTVYLIDFLDGLLVATEARVREKIIALLQAREITDQQAKGAVIHWQNFIFEMNKRFVKELFASIHAELPNAEVVAAQPGNVDYIDLETGALERLSWRTLAEVAAGNYEVAPISDWVVTDTASVGADGQPHDWPHTHGMEASRLTPVQKS